MWRSLLTLAAVLALTAGCGGGGDAAPTLDAVDAGAVQTLVNYAADPATPVGDMRAAADAAVEVYNREPEATLDGVGVGDVLRGVSDGLPARYNDSAVAINEAVGPG